MPGFGLTKYTDYQLIRSKRKSLAIEVKPDASVVVRAPHSLPHAEIESFVKEKSTWIEAKRIKAEAYLKANPSYQDGSLMLYLGETYPIQQIPGDQTQVDFNGQVLRVSGNAPEAFRQFYRQQFEKVALPRLDYYAKTHQLPYRKVRLKAQKTRWGSCGANNDINLNYLLAMAPISVIDYVLIHELCHTRIKNHSKDFWQLVASIAPDYQQAQTWLKQHGYQLQSL